MVEEENKEGKPDQMADGKVEKQSPPRQNVALVPSSLSLHREPACDNP